MPKTINEIIDHLPPERKDEISKLLTEADEYLAKNPLNLFPEYECDEIIGQWNDL